MKKSSLFLGDDMRILVIEDQKKMSEFLRKGLSEAGYGVDVAETGSSGEVLAGEVDYDLIILDVMLPDQNGLDTARHLRRDSYVKPILMLTALSGTPAKVAGLDAGADDYLTKPFEFEELLARVRALLRRHQPDVHQASLRMGDLELNLKTRTATRAGQEIPLTAKEFALLEYLMTHPGRVLTRTAILEHVWDIHFDNNSNVIDVYINMLRKKVDAPFSKKLIHTIVGSGYMLKEAAN
jgi:two-component system, OmpR family, copper resistance phosphate regulon response regulator CusR